MADEDEGGYKIRFLRAEFIALAGNIPIALLRTELTALPLVVPIADARMTLSGNGVIVEWLGDPPTPQDRIDVRAKIAAFVGGTTTNAPLEIESLGITTATSSALVDVLDTTTPALDEGTYQVLWDALVGMLATVTNAGVRGVITLSRIRGVTTVSRQWEHNWTMQQPQLFSGGITFKCAAGDKIRALLQVAKLGAPAATAQMAVARITIDQI